jgi:hypothetical protein
MGLPVWDIKEIIFPLVTELIPRKFNKIMVIFVIKGISGAVIQSWFLKKASYTPYPITAMKGIDTGNMSDRKPKRVKIITPIPEINRDNSPIEYGELDNPKGMLIKLNRHIRSPIKIKRRFWFLVTVPVSFLDK